MLPLASRSAACAHAVMVLMDRSARHDAFGRIEDACMDVHVPHEHEVHSIGFVGAPLAHHVSCPFLKAFWADLGPSGRIMY